MEPIHRKLLGFSILCIVVALLLYISAVSSLDKDSDIRIWGLILLVAQILMGVSAVLFITSLVLICIRACKEPSTETTTQTQPEIKQPLNPYGQV